MKCKYYKPYMDTLREIVSGYYCYLDGCCSGGPLHILLDDNNYDIKSVHFCIDTCFDGVSVNPEHGASIDYGKEVYILGILICNEYAKMTLEERAAFDRYWCGSALECTGDCENCPCHVFGETYDHMKKAEELK